MLEILPPARVAPPSRHAMPTLLERTFWAGLLSFAAVTGVLLGIGRRSGTPWRTLNAAAHLVIDGRADGVWNFQSDVTPIGCLVVLALSMLAAFIVTSVTASRRTPYVLLVAGSVALLGYVLHMQVAARSPGGLAGLLSVGELRALYATLGVALVVGIRLALLPGEGARRR
jgi:hypothetical protein